MARDSFEIEDFQSLADRLDSLSQVKGAKQVQHGMHIQLQDQLVFVRLFAKHRRPGADISASLDEAIDRVLALIDDTLLEVTDSQIYAYDLSHAEEIDNLLAEVLSGTAERQQLDIDDVLEILGEAGFLLLDTPPQVAEIMAGWTITDSSESVLDIAAGSGTLLHKAAEQFESTAPNPRLAGIEEDPFACALARHRLHNKSTEIINADFLNWNLSQQNTGGEQASLMDAAEDEESMEFDAVVGNPPAVRFEALSDEQRERIQDWFSGRPRSVSAVFVAKAVTHLKPGGRAAFVLPKSALRDGLLEHLTESCAIHRIVELPVNSVSGSHQGIEAVVLTVVKEERPPEVRETGIVTFNRMDLPDNARGVFEQPLDAILENRYNPYDAEIAKAAHADLGGRMVTRLLSSPSIYNVLTADGFDRLENLAPEIEVGSGMSSGNNEFFYFDEDERQASGIADRFFRPLIKKLPDGALTITTEDIDQYVLDIQPYISQLEGSASESEIIEQLQRDGYGNLVEYIRSAGPNLTREGISFALDYRGRFQNPDLVIPEFFDDPRCYSVEVDDAMFDSTVIGIRTTSKELKTALHRLLNTPIYREFFQTFANPVDLNWYRINVGQLRDIPVIERALTQDVADKIDAFLPPEDDNDIIGLNQVLIEACSTEEEERALQRYMASRDDYAWSWFMTLPEVERFQELVEEGEEEAREFILEKFDQELLDEARQTFNKLEFFEHRRELLIDLLMEFESAHYRSFLAGITLQFEGILTDLVVKTGGEIIDENGETKFELPGQQRSQQKNLNNLISTFFDGVFSTFLHETIRQRRNAIAHGDVIEDSQDLAIHFFIAFYALCYASLAEYTRTTGTLT